MSYMRPNRGSFPSLKMNQMVKYQSSIERDYMLILEYDPTVKSYEAQSVTIKYKDWDEKKQKWKNRQYTPDFCILKSDHSQVLVECKAKKFVNSEMNQHKFAVARQWCAEHNWTFLVLTEEEIRAQPRFENLKLLWRYARFQERPGILIDIYELLQKTGNTMTVIELARKIDPQNPTSMIPPIYYLVFHHKLIIPIDEINVSPDSPIYLPQKVRTENGLSV